MISVNGYIVKPTEFPDRTSQVWKLAHGPMESIRSSTENLITWDFETEGEIMHCLQLRTLILNTNPGCKIVLHMPYLPYARQDKEVSNEATFALTTFLEVISTYFSNIIVFDPHSKDKLEWTYGPRCHIIEPVEEIYDAIEEVEATLICYPDKGAARRYPFLNDDYRYVTMDKVRDQSTGQITGMVVDFPELVLCQNVLIVDDLCDGGRTFREAAKILNRNGAESVHLYVSHGIFSHPDGVQVLHDDGIDKVFTREGLVSEATVQRVSTK